MHERWYIPNSNKNEINPSHIVYHYHSDNEDSTKIKYINKPSLCHRLDNIIKETSSTNKRKINEDVFVPCKKKRVENDIINKFDNISI